MKQIDLIDGIMRIDTNTENFNMQSIENRRFLFNPQTGALILGIQTSCNDFFYKSDTARRRYAGRWDFSTYISGWVNGGKIHFVPTVPISVRSFYDKALETLVMFYRNNANMKTAVRGFGNTEPQPFENIINESEVELMAEKQKTKAAEAAKAEKTSVTALNLSGDTPYEKMQDILKKLEEGVKNIFEGGRFEQYLACMSKFHNYSFRNTLLILMQKPDASIVAGFNAWQNNHKRTVKRGERGIKIIAPSSYKTKKQFEKINPATQQPFIGWDGKPIMEEKEITVPTFRVATVFDVSQTEGEPLPSLGVDELTGKVANFEEFYAALEKLSPVPIGFEDIQSGAKGYFNQEEKRIAINNGMSEIQTIKTAIHEIAHAKLHDYDIVDKMEQDEMKDRRTREVEAESVAFAVCQHYGIDTSDYSFGYVAGWSKDKELPELNASLETIQKTADEIISGIDEHYRELAKDIEQTAPEIDTTKYKGWEFDGGHVVVNTDADRLQIFFDEKPDENIRAELKDNGFKWAAKITAWQQPITDDAFKAADTIESIKPLDGTLPSELQKQASEQEQQAAPSVEDFKDLPDTEAEKVAAVFEKTDKKAPEQVTQAADETPTMAELEQKAKSGEPVSIMDMIAANEKEKAAKNPKTPSKAKTEKKPSIRKQLKESAQKAADKKKSEPVKDKAKEDKAL